MILLYYNMERYTLTHKQQLYNKESAGRSADAAKKKIVARGSGLYGNLAQQQDGQGAEDQVGGNDGHERRQVPRLAEGFAKA
jgi:hypothetical protein